MNTKSDSTKLQILSQSNIQRLEIEINNIVDLYKLDRISGISAHKKLHYANKDLHEIFWKVTRVIGAAHGQIDFLHKLKRTMTPIQDRPNYLSQHTIESIDLLLQCEKLVRCDISDMKILKRCARNAKQLLKQNVRCLRTEINDLVRDAPRMRKQNLETYNKDADQKEIEFEELKPEEMEIRKVTSE